MFSKMSSNAEVKPKRHEEIREETKRQLQQLDDDSTDQDTLRSICTRNRQIISQLRQENKELYRRQAEAEAADELLIKAAFQKIGREKEAYRNITLKDALVRVEQTVLDKLKRLNAQRFNTQTQRQRLQQLLRAERQTKKTGGAAQAEARRRDEDATCVRSLENNLEKMQLKCEMAEYIGRGYEDIKAQLQEEMRTFPLQLDRLEATLLQHRDELHALELLEHKALLDKDATELELQQLEKSLAQQREERKRLISSYRDQIKECDAQIENCDKRVVQVQKAVQHADELSGTQVTSDKLTAIFAAEEAVQHMKELTGASSVQELKERCDSEKEKQLCLEKTIEENKELLQQQKELRDLLRQQLEEMKSASEANRSSFQQILEEHEQQRRAADQQRDASKKRVEQLRQTLSTVTAGVQHIVDKLEDITVSEDGMWAEPPDAEQQAVQLLRLAELKLQKLLQDVQAEDMSAALREMQQKEFTLWMENNMPTTNTRVKVSSDDEDNADGD
ncbi:hypothetical protein LDENG_00055280 [Lucifuga dentata]|nr:hypothetical protein LDENG_00055280 [Lucifuga dentata]